MALARELGLPSEPRLLADRSHLVVALEPHPVVARIAMATSLVRVGMEWLRREVEVSRFLAEAGAFVTTPTTAIPAGPFERGGLVISFWARETLRGELEPREVGARFADLHRRLRAYAPERLPLWGAFEEARAVLARARTNGVMTRDELSRLERAWERGERIVESARSRTASFQAVHGDAHLGNVLSTSRGAVFTDWEDAFLGPVEWDLATFVSRARTFGEERGIVEPAVAAYDGDFEPALVDELVLVRNLQVIPWLAAFGERQPEVLERMRARLARLP